MKLVSYYQYVFYCPTHGPETDVLCFRAFDPRNRFFWSKHKFVPEEVLLTEDDLDKHLKMALQDKDIVPQKEA